MRGRVEISGINTAKLPVLKNDEMTVLLRQASTGVESSNAEYKAADQRGAGRF